MRFLVQRFAAWLASIHHEPKMDFFADRWCCNWHRNWYSAPDDSRTPVDKGRLS